MSENEIERQRKRDFIAGFRARNPELFPGAQARKEVAAAPLTHEPCAPLRLSAAALASPMIGTHVQQEGAA